MATITINKQIKAGKLFFEMAKLLSKHNTKDVIIENPEPRYRRKRNGLSRAHISIYLEG
jgi:hypothetical protein